MDRATKIPGWGELGHQDDLEKVFDGDISPRRPENNFLLIDNDFCNMAVMPRKEMGSSFYERNFATLTSEMTFLSDMQGSNPSMTKAHDVNLEATMSCS